MGTPDYTGALDEETDFVEDGNFRRFRLEHCTEHRYFVPPDRRECHRELEEKYARKMRCMINKRKRIPEMTRLLKTLNDPLGKKHIQQRGKSTTTDTQADNSAATDTITDNSATITDNSATIADNSATIADNPITADILVEEPNIICVQLLKTKHVPKQTDSPHQRNKPKKRRYSLWRRILQVFRRSTSHSKILKSCKVSN